MPRPTANSLHVNRPLTNISVAYMQSATGFVANRVFPSVPVEKQSDRYFVFDRGEFNRDEALVRAPATESAGGGFTVDNTPTYYAPVWAFHKDIDDQIRANVDDPIDLDRAATEYVTQKLMIRRERAWTAKYMVGSVWTYERTGVAAAPSGVQFIKWSDSANSDPIKDLRAGMTAVRESTGFTPNKLTVARDVYDVLVDHPDIVDRVKYGQTPGSPAMVTRAAIAALLELDEVLVQDAIHNTAKEGQTDSHAFVGTGTALLTHSPARPSLMTPSAGYTFNWSGLIGSNNAMRIRRFRLEPKSADRVEGEIAFDQKVVGPDLGAIFLAAI